MHAYSYANITKIHELTSKTCENLMISSIVHLICKRNCCGQLNIRNKMSPQSMVVKKCLNAKNNFKLKTRIFAKSPGAHFILKISTNQIEIWNLHVHLQYAAFVGR